jgi:hypothetical protein
MKMNNVFDKKYSEIIDNTKSVDLTKELENRLRTKAQEELIKTLEEKDKKLLKLANETNSKEAPYSHAPRSRLTNKNSELDKKDIKAYYDDFQKFLQEEGLKTEPFVVDAHYIEMLPVYEKQRKLKVIGVEPPGLFKSILDSIEDLNKKNDENKKLIELANKKAEAKDNALFNEIKTDMNCMKSFLEKEDLTSERKLPVRIQTIPTFIDVIEHIPEDKMPDSVYFLVPDDLPINDKIIAKYQFVKINNLPQELKRVIYDVQRFGHAYHQISVDKKDLIESCEKLLDSVKKL